MTFIPLPQFHVYLEDHQRNPNKIKGPCSDLRSNLDKKCAMVQMILKGRINPGRIIMNWKSAFVHMIIMISPHAQAAAESHQAKKNAPALDI